MNSDDEKCFVSTGTLSKPQERMPELYNMLTKATKTNHTSLNAHDSTFEDISDQRSSFTDLKWTKLQMSNARNLYEIPSEIIRNACREKRSRGYIARILAAKNSSTGQTDSRIDASISQGNDEEDVNDEDSVSPARKKTRKIRRKFSESQEEEKAGHRNICMKRWRVRSVVDNHIETMKALSQLTINITTMPGDLKHMDLKPRLLGSDRIAILQYQEKMRNLLEEEHEILRNIQECLRTAVLHHNLPEEEARREAEEAADQLDEYCC